MDIGKSFTFSFQDKNWIKKYLLGALISIVPILNFAWVGYLVELMRNVTEDALEPLPEWDEFGDKFVKGLLLAIAGFIYSLPGMILLFIPLMALPFADLSSGDVSEAFGAVFAGASFLFICLVSLYFLAFSFFYPAVFIHFSREGTFGSCFQIGKIVQIATSNMGKYLTAWLISIVAGFGVGLVAGLVSSLFGLIPCLGWIISLAIGAFAGVWIATIYAHLFGQVAAQPAMEF